MKIIVAGSRTFSDEERVYKILDKVYTKRQDIEIVSGLAKGPDMWGKQWAEWKGIKVHEFPANWQKYGKKAGYLRNEEMAKFSVPGALIAFWSQGSRGTMHMIDLAKKHGLKVVVIHDKLEQP